MRETWRWFGEFDAIPLSDIAQTGAAGIVSALHAIPYGEVWSTEAIAARRSEIEAAGFTWDVVESLPVHEAVKTGAGDLSQIFANYRQSLANLASEGIKTVCYNFMPVLDWTRTDLASPVARGGTCLRFEAAKMAAFEMHILGRDGAEDTYTADALGAGNEWIKTATPDDHAELLNAIMAGLPGAVDTYDVDGLRKVLSTYDGVTHDELRANLKRFLEEVVPTAAELGINMCIHPDDPPRDILGLPRICSNKSDVEWILNSVDEDANGLTICTGSLGANSANDLPDIARTFADRVHFAHLRNVTTDPDGSFEEAAHLGGDVHIPDVIRPLMETEARTGRDIPFRADHGHCLLTDFGQDVQSGYTLVGRLRGLAELRGIIHTLA